MLDDVEEFLLLALIEPKVLVSPPTENNDRCGDLRFKLFIIIPGMAVVSSYSMCICVFVGWVTGIGIPIYVEVLDL